MGNADGCSMLIQAARQVPGHRSAPEVSHYPLCVCGRGLECFPPTTLGLRPPGWGPSEGRKRVHVSRCALFLKAWPRNPGMAECPVFRPMCTNVHRVCSPPSCCWPSSGHHFAAGAEVSQPRTGARASRPKVGRLGVCRPPPALALCRLSRAAQRLGSMLSSRRPLGFVYSCPEAWKPIKPQLQFQSWAPRARPPTPSPLSGGRYWLSEFLPNSLAVFLNRPVCYCIPTSVTFLAQRSQHSLQPRLVLYLEFLRICSGQRKGPPVPVVAG